MKKKKKLKKLIKKINEKISELDIKANKAFQAYCDADNKLDLARHTYETESNLLKTTIKNSLGEYTNKIDILMKRTEIDYTKFSEVNKNEKEEIKKET